MGTINSSLSSSPFSQHVSFIIHREYTTVTGPIGVQAQPQRNPPQTRTRTSRMTLPSCPRRQSQHPQHEPRLNRSPETETWRLLREVSVPSLLTKRDFFQSTGRRRGNQPGHAQMMQTKVGEVTTTTTLRPFFLLFFFFFPSPSPSPSFSLLSISPRSPRSPLHCIHTYSQPASHRIYKPSTSVSPGGGGGHRKGIMEGLIFLSVWIPIQSIG